MFCGMIVSMNQDLMELYSDYLLSSLSKTIAGMDFPVLLFRHFKNKDGSTGSLYLVCSDLSCNGDKLKTIYQKRWESGGKVVGKWWESGGKVVGKWWKVEVFHKTLKSNASMAKSPLHRVRTQNNPIFLSIYSVFRLEVLSSKLKMNHFQLRAKIDMKALRSSFDELRTCYTPMPVHNLSYYFCMAD